MLKASTMNTPLTLVSHPLCPYVQRAAIVMAEKGLSFERIDIDLAHKPDWFLQISPQGKTPVLLVGEAQQPIFESAAICEYLDETALPALHPQNAVARARHRGWMEFGSALLNGIAAFYQAADESALHLRARELRQKFEQLEAELKAGPNVGPWFAGARFSLVDAVFAPVFRYFEVFDTMADFGCLQDLPRVQAWRTALAQRPSVQTAVAPDYALRLRRFLAARGSAIAARLAVTEPSS